jgi:hypothetical protein
MAGGKSYHWFDEDQPENSYEADFRASHGSASSTLRIDRRCSDHRHDAAWVHSSSSSATATSASPECAARCAGELQSV